MTLEFKVGKFPKSGTTSGLPFTVQHITGLTFQPKAVILFSNQSNSNLTNIMRPSIGWSTGPTVNYSISWGADDAPIDGSNNPLPVSTTNPTNSFRRAKDTYCFCAGSGGTTTAPHIKVSSFDWNGTTGGITFQYENQNDNSTYDIEYIVLGGSDIANIEAGSFIPNTTTGPQNIALTSVSGGFQPDCILFMGANTPVPTAGTGSVPHAQWFFGAATPTNSGVTGQGVTTGLSIDALTTATASARYQSTGSSIAYISETGTTSNYTLSCEIAVSQTIAGGFRLNVLTAPDTNNDNPVFFLAIKGARWNVGNVLQPSAGGSQPKSGLGFIPKGAIFWSDAEADKATLSTPISNNHRYSIGAATGGTNTWCLSGGDSNNVTTAQSARGTISNTTGSGSPSSCIRCIRELADGTTSDITAEAQLATFDSTGFTLSWTDVTDSGGSTLARQILFLAAGDSPAVTNLVRIVNDTVAINEATKATKVILRVPAANTVAITETVTSALGKVRVVGGQQATGPGGFMAEGFLSSDFTTASTGVASPDYSVADFLSTDYITTTPAAPIPPEGIKITETIVVKVAAGVAEFLLPSELVLRYSGGATYNGTANKGVDSKGGAISNFVVPNNTLNAAWDDVEFAEATSGEDEVRCFYVKNNSTTLTAYDVHVWIDPNSPGGDTIEIANGQASVNNAETPVTDENTMPSTLITFSSAPNFNSSIDIGDIPALGYKSIWVKRKVPANTPSYDGNSYTLRFGFVSDHV